MTVCARKSSHGKPEATIFRRTCLQGWPLLMSGNLALQPSPKWQEWLTVPRLFAQTLWFTVNTCFPSGILECWYMLNRVCLCSQMKNTFGTKSLMGFPEQKHCTHITEFFAAGERSMLGMAPHRRERALEVCAWDSPDSTCMPSPCWSCHASFCYNKP